MLASRMVRISRLISTSRSFFVGGVGLLSVSLRGTILTATYMCVYMLSAMPVLLCASVLSPAFSFVSVFNASFTFPMDPLPSVLLRKNLPITRLGLIVA